MNTWKIRPLSFHEKLLGKVEKSWKKEKVVWKKNEKVEETYCLVRTYVRSHNSEGVCIDELKEFYFIGFLSLPHSILSYLILFYLILVYVYVFI